MVHGYVPNSNDNIREAPRGGIILEDISGVDWLHNKSNWQMMGILLGALPDIFDQNGNSAMMTMNGIPIEITYVSKKNWRL